MKIKIVYIVCLASMMTLAEEVVTPEVRQARIYAKTGGWVWRENKGRQIKFVNNCGTVAKAPITYISAAFSRLLMLPVVVEQDVKVTLPVDENDGIVVVFCRLPDEKSRITVNVDDRLAFVNVSRVEEDGATGEVLGTRVLRCGWKAVGALLGAGYGRSPDCVMATTPTISDIDKLPSNHPCPPALEAMRESARKLGIFPRARCSYRKACEEGWAPAPTNDIQKAIWEKVHSIPDKPLKITYDKDKQKPVVK